MKRQINRLVMLEWRESVGGPREAARLIANCLRCGASKAEKLAAGRYPSEPNPLELEALTSLINKPIDVLFPVVQKRSRKAS